MQKMSRKGQKVKLQGDASYTWIVTHKGWANEEVNTFGNVLLLKVGINLLNSTKKPLRTRLENLFLRT